MHLLYFGTSLLALVAFAPAMLAPGYLLAWAINLCGFRRMRWPERVLWSLALSSPLAILLSVYGGLLLGNRGVGALFLLLLASATILCWKAPLPGVPAGWFRSAPVMFLCLLASGVAAYLLCAGAPLEVRGRLLEGVVSADWSVRVPLIGSAIRTGMPLVNPFYAVDGQVGPLRYYMYWYALSGVIGRTFHLPARAIMEAGCAWAAVLMFATLFLLLKYLFRPAPEWPAMRWAAVCVGCVCAMPILGLDVLQAIYSLLVVPMMSPEIEWWRAFADFSPSFHTMFLYAPHHTFGVCAGFAGLLLLLLPRLPTAPEGGATPARMLLLGALAGLCFGATGGTSSYVALFFALVCVFVGLDFAIRRDWWMVLAIAVSGVVAVGGTWEFLHLVLGNPVHGGAPFVSLHLRGWTSTRTWFVSQFTQRGWNAPNPWLRRLALPVLYAALELAEAGVFAVVLVHRMRRDLFGGRPLRVEQRMQWSVTLAFFLCALFLTSAGALPSNDLGYHAGFLLRVVAVLWTAPWMVTLWSDPVRRHGFVHSSVGQFALVLAVVGLGTQAWQVVGQRFSLLAPGAFHRFDGPFPSPPHLAHQYEEAFQAWQAIDRLLPQNAHVLTNPDSAQRTLQTLYANRQMIAPEPKCMAAFGGDPEACRKALPEIRKAFGDQPSGAAAVGPGAAGMGTIAAGVGPDAASTVASFAVACRSQHATAVLVTADDAVWSQPQSWVWQIQPVYGNSRERLYLCGSTP